MHVCFGLRLLFRLHVNQPLDLSIVYNYGTAKVKSQKSKKNYYSSEPFNLYLCLSLFYIYSETAKTGKLGQSLVCT